MRRRGEDGRFIVNDVPLQNQQINPFITIYLFLQNICVLLSWLPIVFLCYIFYVIFKINEVAHSLGVQVVCGHNCSCTCGKGESTKNGYF